jgi:serine/threonine protein kinase
MSEFDSCRIGGVGVRFDGDGALEFHSSSPTSSGILVSERKALRQLSRIRKSYSLTNCFICEPSGGLSLNEDDRTVLRLLLPHSSPSWLPLSCLDARHHSQILSAVADQLCEWHSVGVIHRTISPNCILVDPSPPSSTKIVGPAVVLLHWACSSFFDATSNAMITHSKLLHRIPSFAAPGRLRLESGASPSPSEDFYGLGLMVRSSLHSGADGILKQPSSVPDGGNAAADLSAHSSLNQPSNSDSFWSLHVLRKPASTVLDHILQPDPLLSAFQPSKLQSLISAHGSQVFTASCASLAESHQSNTDMLASLSISVSAFKSSAESEVASLAWIQSIICELVSGKCVSALLCREVLNVFVTGVSVKKDVICFLHMLVQDHVLFKPVTWFTYLDIHALKQYDISVEKSTTLMQQYPTLDPCIQALLLHLAVCPYFMPFDELVSIVKVRDCILWLDTFRIYVPVACIQT